MPKYNDASRLADHVFSIAQENDIIIWESNSMHGIAYLDIKEMEIPPVKSPISYMVAMHELGHFLHPQGDRFKTSDELLSEVAAWEWAFSNSITPLTPKLKRRAWEQGLGTYFKSAAIRQGEIGDDHPIFDMASKLGITPDKSLLEYNRVEEQRKRSKETIRELYVGQVTTIADTASPKYLRGKYVEITDIRRTRISIKILEEPGGKRFYKGQIVEGPATIVNP